VNEADLVDALNSGQCGGAGFDVFVEEPPKNRALMEHPKFVGTPHLGASTIEAQVRVAEEIAEQIVKLNEGSAMLGAINAEAVSCALDKNSASVVNAVSDLAVVAHAINTSGKTQHVVVEATGPENLKKMEVALKAAAMIGVLKGAQATKLNLVNALNVGKAAGVEVEVKYHVSHNASHEFVVKVGDATARGRPTTCGTLLWGIGHDAFAIGVPLHKWVVFFEGNAETFTDVRKNNIPGTVPAALFMAEGNKRQAAVYKDKVDGSGTKNLHVVHFDV